MPSNHRKSLFIWVIALILSACSHEKHDNADRAAAQEYFKMTGRENSLNEEVILIFVPMFAGCHSCELHVIELLKGNVDNKNVSFIFSMAKGHEKDYQNLIRSEFSNHEPANLFVDFDNLAMKLDLVFSQPKIVYSVKDDRGSVELTAINIDDEIGELKQVLANK